MKKSVTIKLEETAHKKAKDESKIFFGCRNVSQFIQMLIENYKRK